MLKVAYSDARVLKSRNTRSEKESQGKIKQTEVCDKTKGKLNESEMILIPRLSSKKRNF